MQTFFSYHYDNIYHNDNIPSHIIENETCISNLIIDN